MAETNVTEAPLLIPAAHGRSRALEGGDTVVVDCGNALGDISLITIKFRDPKKAWAAYCRDLKIEITTVPSDPGAA